MRDTVSKSPAFQFYPQDFMAGAPSEMSPDETHVYVWLLCRDWTQNGFEHNTARLAHFCRLSPKRFAKAWQRVSSCFELRDGRYYNPRLDQEREKQAAWRAKSAKGGSTTLANRTKGGTTTLAPPYPPPHPPKGHTSVFSLQSSSSDYVEKNGGGGVDKLLRALPATRRAAFSAKLAAWQQGMDLPAGVKPPDPDTLDRVCLDVLASVEVGQITPRVVGGFLRRDAAGIAAGGAGPDFLSGAEEEFRDV